jgi:hypothetical protein
MRRKHNGDIQLRLHYVGHDAGDERHDVTVRVPANAQRSRCFVFLPFVTRVHSGFYLYFAAKIMEQLLTEVKN